MVAARRAALLGGLALVLAAGCGQASSAAERPSRPDSSATASKTSAADKFRSTRTYRTVAVPVRLRIPAIGVDTRLEGLGRAPDRTIALPSGPGLAGWYDEGPRPGEPGPAAILGHVDWDSSPAVFFRLRELRPGAVVLVDRADGGTGHFRVTHTRQIAKSRFPTDEVYAPDLAPSLRLITCGGSFDHSTRNYRDNVIVFATPA
jgi:sortase (surface protein transpeptidase)